MGVSASKLVHYYSHTDWTVLYGLLGSILRLPSEIFAKTQSNRMDSLCHPFSLALR